MSDDFFSLPPIPLMTPERALYLGRACKAMAEQYVESGVRPLAARMERDSNWWLAYSIALAQTPPAKPTP